MQHIHSPLVELLESRRLLSVAPATLAQDQVQLQTDQAAYETHKKSCADLIAKDKAKVEQDRINGNAGVVVLQKKLKQDQAFRKATLATDKANLKLAIKADKAVIVRDKLAIRIDKNNPAQLALDQQKLAQDKIQLESDQLKFGTILINDDASTQSTIFADEQAIETARFQIDNTALQADQAILLADRQSCLAMLAADQIKILADRLKIAQDSTSA